MRFRNESGINLENYESDKEKSFFRQNELVHFDKMNKDMIFPIFNVLRQIIYNK